MIYFRPFVSLYTLTACLLFYLIINNRIVEAGIVLTISVGLSLILCTFIEGKALFFTMFIFVFSPFLAFLRQNVISYNGISIILFISLILWIFQQRGKVFLETISDRRIIGILLFVGLYVIYGLLSGTPLERFMRFVETVLAILVLSMLLKTPEFVRKYLIFFIVSSILIVLSLLPHIETRFVFETDEGFSKADPSAYSIGLVLSIFLLLEDEGKWLFKVSNTFTRFLRYSFAAIATIMTFLTTSRVGFFTLFGSYFIYLLLTRFNAQGFKKFLIILPLAVTIILYSRFSDVMEYWINKTFRNERGIASATTGRSDQWKMAGYYLLHSNPQDILLGYNPGKGADFSREYSRVTPGITVHIGKSVVLHSLYLIFFVEFGLLAFLFFIIFLYKRFKEVYQMFKNYQVSLPLLSFFAYILYIGSVAGVGIIPGMLITFFLAHFDVYEYSSEKLH